MFGVWPWDLRLLCSQIGQVQAKKAFSCPIDRNTGRPMAGEMADPESCGMFYHCSNGHPFHKACPRGLHFNPVLRICDWPHNAKCEERKKGGDERSFQCPVNPVTKVPIDGEFPDPRDCSMWYHCSNGIPFHKPCPATLHFDRVRRRCEWPSIANCKPETGNTNLQFCY